MKRYNYPTSVLTESLHGQLILFDDHENEIERLIKDIKNKKSYSDIIDFLNMYLLQKKPLFKENETIIRVRYVGKETRFLTYPEALAQRHSDPNFIRVQANNVALPYAFGWTDFPKKDFIRDER